MMRVDGNNSKYAGVLVVAVHPLAARIAELRQARGWTQGKLAQRAEVSRAYITKLEQGKVKRPSGAVLNRLADALGVSLEDLSIAAGYRLERPKAKTEEDILLDGFRRLPDEDREEILETIERKVQRRRRRLGERREGQSS